MKNGNHDIDVGDAVLHCRVDGVESGRWLVFSNSLMTDLSMWDGEAAAFAADRRILRYDQRGHGGSTIPAVPCTFERLADDLAAVLDRLGIDTVTLVGISMGAATAATFAVRHPSRLEALAICDVASSSGPNGRAMWDERIALARAQGMEDLAEVTVRRWFRPESIAAGIPGVKKVQRMIAATPVEGFAAAANALQDFDLAPSLPRITARTGLFVGSNDGGLPEIMAGMSRAIPGASLNVVPDAGHLINIEQPGHFHDALRAFLRP